MDKNILWTWTCGSNTFRLQLGQTPILECCSGRTVNPVMPTRTSPSIPSTVDMSSEDGSLLKFSGF